jgi:hypothetical protein
MSDEIADGVVAADLALWYPAFEVYAASTTSENPIFHGPHVAPPASLDRVQAGLAKLVETYGDAIRNDPLLSLEVLRAELTKRRQELPQSRSDNEGSPWHNFWHWVHG